jgi:hypothetical protein
MEGEALANQQERVISVTMIFSKGMRSLARRH